MNQKKRSISDIISDKEPTHKQHGTELKMLFDLAQGDDQSTRDRLVEKYKQEGEGILLHLDDNRHKRCNVKSWILFARGETPRWLLRAGQNSCQLALHIIGKQMSERR